MNTSKSLVVTGLIAVSAVPYTNEMVAGSGIASGLPHVIQASLAEEEGENVPLEALDKFSSIVLLAAGPQPYNKSRT